MYISMKLHLHTLCKQNQRQQNWFINETTTKNNNILYYDRLEWRSMSMSKSKARSNEQGIVAVR